MQYSLFRGSLPKVGPAPPWPLFWDNSVQIWVFFFFPFSRQQAGTGELFSPLLVYKPEMSFCLFPCGSLGFARVPSRMPSSSNESGECSPSSALAAAPLFCPVETAWPARSGYYPSVVFSEAADPVPSDYSCIFQFSLCSSTDFGRSRMHP